MELCIAPSTTGFWGPACSLTRHLPEKAEGIDPATRVLLGFLKKRHLLGGAFKISYCHSYLGKILILTNLFQKG